MLRARLTRVEAMQELAVVFSFFGFIFYFLLTRFSNVNGKRGFIPPTPFAVFGPAMLMLIKHKVVTNINPLLMGLVLVLLQTFSACRLLFCHQDTGCVDLGVNSSYQSTGNRAGAQRAREGKDVGRNP